MRLAGVVALLAILGGCGYVAAGKWEDDPRNWERAFREPPPPGIRVVNSVYWRYPHFTFEGGYFFRVRVSAAQKDRLANLPGLIELKGKDAEVHGPCEATPAWFAPKGLNHYRVLTWSDKAANQRIIIDPESDEVFFTGCQW